MLDRIQLICRPTPLHRLDRASDILGIDLWIKRDDLTGFAGGGNKGRKLEFLIRQALDMKADAIVSRGAWQSNFLRQCGAACRMFGIEFHAAAMHWPYPAPGRETRPPDWQVPTLPSGNQILNLWTDTRITLYPDGTFSQLNAYAHEIAERLRSQGKRVLELPGGGSSPVGAFAYVAAVEEVREQAPPFDNFVFASGSGGTQVGITFATKLNNLPTNPIGIATDDEPEMTEDFVEISAGLDELLGTNLDLQKNDFQFHVEFCGGGYQVPDPDAENAIRFLAQTEGIFLDPVYTAKAFNGLMQLAKQGQLKGRTLFWHTGGFPVLFAHGRAPKSAS